MKNVISYNIVIPASRSEAKAQAIQQNRAWPGIQGYTPDSINSTLDSCFRRNDKQVVLKYYI